MDAPATWKRLRVKPDPTADDRDWVANLESPNRITAVVGGTTTAGDYSITVTGFAVRMSGRIEINRTVTFTRAAENDAAIAAALEALLDAALASTQASSPSLASLGVVADVSSATITITSPPNVYVTWTASAPGSATITFPLGATLPITASSPMFDRSGEMNANSILVVVHQRASTGATLAPGSGTISMQAIEICEIRDVGSDGQGYSTRYINAPLTGLTGVALNAPYEIPLRGAKYWTVRITTDASLSGSVADLEVIYRDGVT